MFFLSYLLRRNIYILLFILCINIIHIPNGNAKDQNDTVFSDYLRAYFSDINHDSIYANKLFSRLLQNDTDNSIVQNNSLRNALELGDFNSAEQIARKLFVKQNNHSLAKFVLGIQALKKSNYKEARLYFLTHSKKKIFILLDYLVQAWTHFAERKPKIAVNTLKKMVKKHKDLNFFYMFHYALMSDLMNNRKNAHTLYLRAYNKTPNNRRLVEAYGRHLLRNNYFTQAGKVYKKALEKDPNLFFENALKWSENHIKPPFIVTNAKEGLAEIFYGVALNLIYNGESRIAHIYLKAALELRPDQEQATLLLAEIYQSLNLCNKAITYYKKITDKSLAYKASQLQIANCLIQQKKVNEAEKKLRYLLALYPKNEQLLKGLANFYRIEKKYIKAQKIYLGLLKNRTKFKKDDWEIYYHLGITYERTKQWDQAEEYLLSAMKLDDKQPALLNYLGYSWIDRKKNLTEGLRYIKNALKIRPNDGYILDSLGWAHYQLNNFNKAVTELEKAILILPGDPIINDHLGDAFWKVGRKKEAIYQWHRALKMKPEDDNIKKIEDKIAAAQKKNIF